MKDNPKINSSIAIGLYLCCLSLVLVAFLPVGREIESELNEIFTIIYLIIIPFSIITFTQLSLVSGKRKVIYSIKAGLPFIHIIIFIITLFT